MVGSAALAGLGWLALCLPPPAPGDAAWNAPAPPPFQLAQAGGIKGSDPETADKGQGNTGWVQAPTPRGRNAPEQAAQGSGAKPADGSAGAPGTPGHGGGQAPPGENPMTPMPTAPTPGPAGLSARPGSGTP